MDLSFITVKVTDGDGLFVANADNLINFLIEGPGEIIATDNGDPSDFTEFPSHSRKAFSGKALAIVRSIEGDIGSIIITAKSKGLSETKVIIKSK